MANQAQIKHAAEDLLSLLQRSELALDAVARKLDVELAARYDGSRALNPLQLSKRIRRLARQLPTLTQECQAIMQRKQALIDAAKHKLLANRAQLLDLSTQVALTPEEDTATISDFTEALASWDHALQSTGQSGYMSREELNHALAASILARQ